MRLLVVGPNSTPHPPRRHTHTPSCMYTYLIVLYCGLLYIHTYTYVCDVWTQRGPVTVELQHGVVVSIQTAYHHHGTSVVPLPFSIGRGGAMVATYAALGADHHPPSYTPALTTPHPPIATTHIRHIHPPTNPLPHTHPTTGRPRPRGPNLGRRLGAARLHRPPRRPPLRAGTILFAPAGLGGAVRRFPSFACVRPLVVDGHDL